MASDRIEEGSDDVLLIRERVKAALDRARAGEGPTFIEVVTYRYRGHSMSDPAKYRSKEEVEMWRQSRDPLTRARGRLLHDMGVAEAQVAAIEADVEKQIEEVVRFAEESPLPELEEMDRWVYATPLS
jgi:pyruvate dehydrogenase E1 component alpha subunit